MCSGIGISANNYPKILWRPLSFLFGKLIGSSNTESKGERDSLLLPKVDSLESVYPRLHIGYIVSNDILVLLSFNNKLY